jgi:thrombospondin type 3 repeat protein
MMEFRNKILPVLLLLAAMSFAPQSWSEITINTNLSGACDSNTRATRGELVGSIVDPVEPPSQGSYFQIFLDFWQMNDINTGAPLYRCTEEISVIVSNEPVPPATGFSAFIGDVFEYGVVIAAYRAVHRSRQNDLRKCRAEGGCRPIFRTVPTPGGGVRGSLGILLFENSPAYYLLEQIDENDSNSAVGFPFVVLSSDPESGDDWLSVQLDGFTFFKQPLASFTVGSVYEVVVPLDVLEQSAKGSVWTFFLNSAGNSTSEVYFPMEFIEEEGDRDGDTVPDDLDVCPNTAVGDLVDTVGCSAAQVDGDGDGVCDVDAPSNGPSMCIGMDNCPFDYNPSQVNFDSDDLGDACDTDIDGDGVANESDLCGMTMLDEVVEPATGCSLIQLTPCDGPFGGDAGWRNHGKYVSALAKTSKVFVNAGLISDQERGLLMQSAASSSCGR